MEQLKDILPNIVISVVMGIAINFIALMEMPKLLILLIQVILGIVIYLLLSVVFKNESLSYMLEIVKPMLNRILKKQNDSMDK